MSDAPEVRLLIFRVGDLVCAAEVDRVREILPRVPTTRIPGAPPTVVGLANIRGTLVTVVEAWRLLGQASGNGHGRPQQETGESGGRGGGEIGVGATTVLLDVGSGRRLVALAVDEVMDLVVLAGGALEQGEALPGLDPALVRAVGRRADGLFVVLDTDALLSPILSD